MYIKKSGRPTYKSNRRSSFKKPGGYSNHKGRNRGNVSQQYNKYLKLAKEASRSGDRIQSEYYYQFTDHYFRLMIELGISVDENNQLEDTKSSNNENEESENENSVKNSEQESSQSEENDSIESIPFIAESTNDKRTRSSK